MKRMLRHMRTDGTEARVPAFLEDMMTLRLSPRQASISARFAWRFARRLFVSETEYHQE